MATIRSQKEIRQRAPWWLAGLLFANFALMSYDARENSTKQRMIRVWAQTLAYPVQRVTSGAGGAGVGFFQRLGNLRGAASENEQLKVRLAQIETEARDARTNAAENERLRSLLSLREKSNYKTLGASVIARDPSLWFDTVTIDRGRSAGVENNMPVVNADGIVGRVISTSLWSAQVMLITNEKSGAGAVVGQLGQSSALGSIRGLGEKGLLEMRYVSGLEKVAAGDYVVTTGQDGVFPAGYKIGEVVEVKSGSATQAHVIHLRASARMDQLKDVLVLQYHPPERSASDQSLPNAEKKLGGQQ
jgi:rod shape-determining protein MreC